MHTIFRGMNDIPIHIFRTIGIFRATSFDYTLISAVSTVGSNFLQNVERSFLLLFDYVDRMLYRIVVSITREASITYLSSVLFINLVDGSICLWSLVSDHLWTMNLDTIVLSKYVMDRLFACKTCATPAYLFCIQLYRAIACRWMCLLGRVETQRLERVLNVSRMTKFLEEKK